MPETEEVEIQSNRAVMIAALLASAFFFWLSLAISFAFDLGSGAGRLLLPLGLGVVVYFLVFYLSVAVRHLICTRSGARAPADRDTQGGQATE
ncbi:hypothetical protein LVO79_09400 [Roseivivax marinus]|uniref:hypothetical protein n=1 Tax=Roseivivax marinus TaxID=1379903 RepID=UPI001F048B09|nr:hypothetical protein [Roseivivax marinus]UMA63299.1 hypothetical protein LVO79_09400 [Roseivivax marinus]